MLSLHLREKSLLVGQKRRNVVDFFGMFCALKLPVLRCGQLKSFVCLFACLLLCLFSETGLLCVALAGLELTL